MDAFWSGSFLADRLSRAVVAALFDAGRPRQANRFSRSPNRVAAAVCSPWKQSELAAHPVAFGLVPQVLLVSTFVCYLLGRATSDVPLRSLLWIVAPAASMLGLLYIDQSLEGSRYVYLALTGWALLLAECVRGSGRPIVRGIAAVVLSGLVALGSWGVRRHQESWVAAAEMRDEVIRQAIQAIDDNRCASAVFSRAPLKVEGAFVFVNGLSEAVAGYLAKRRAPDTLLTPCSFEWSGTDFRLTS